jgi:hypothetical protein
MVATSSVQVAATTVSAGTPVVQLSSPAPAQQVSVSMGGQTFNFTITGTTTSTPITSVSQSPVSVAAGQAPYLMSLSTGVGADPIGILITKALSQLIQSLGPNGANKDLLKQIATFLLQNAFSGIDLSKALPEIEKIIAALLNPQSGGGATGGGSGGATGGGSGGATGSGSGGTLPAGTYQIQGTITIGGGGTPAVNPPGNTMPVDLTPEGGSVAPVPN